MGDRRAFLSGMLAAGLMPAPTWAEAGDPAYVSAAKRPDDKYVLCGLSASGSILFELALPDRGHAAAAHPKRAEAVAFARRPGRFAVVIDCLSGAELARLDAPEGRHFYGHGAFSAEGDLLLTSENDYDAARGIVGVWDVLAGYRRVGEFATGGIGPHDMKLIPGQNRLVVANGGIETHPETGRVKLNIPTMRPSLTYLTLDGEIVEQMELDPALHKNSIRHLDVAPDGRVAFAMQWQGDLVANPPLLGIHRQGAAPMLMDAGPDAVQTMAGYAGSVAIAPAQNQVAITSPRGGTLQVYDLFTGALAQSLAIEDVCGISRTARGFFVTSGRGFTIPHVTGVETRATKHRRRWDNHLIAI
ncbi:MAG: DUF1513 domain-containing protein [Pseudomonadota bacterium]